MRLRVTILVLISSLGLGCFVFDELDASKKLLDKPGFAIENKKKEAPASPEPRQEAREGGSKDRVTVGDWWKKARSVTSHKATSDLVQCELRGTTKFMRRTDCQVRGGTPR